MNETIVVVTDRYAYGRHKTKEELPLSSVIENKLKNNSSEGELESLREQVSDLRQCISKLLTVLYDKDLLNESELTTIANLNNYNSIIKFPKKR